MAERDPFELVEMSPGAPPPTGFGDRILVGLALIALVAGAMVAVANLIPDPAEVAEASVAPSEEPARTPRPTPTPAPPRVAILQDPDIGLAPVEQSYVFDGWIRASVDLVVRSSPDLEATQTGVLLKDAITYASAQDQGAEEPGWLFAEDEQGWVATIAGGEQLARRYEYPQYKGSGWINSVTAGPNGFVAMITPPGGGQYGYGPPRPAISTTGASWRGASPPAFDRWWVESVAHGPSGWLAAASVDEESLDGVLLWSSTDGLRWSRLGILDEMKQEDVVRLVGAENGYLMETQQYTQGYSRPNTLWSSADGLIWTESSNAITNQGGDGDRRLVAVAGGFYLWDNGSSLVAPGSSPAFSVDGSAWTGLDDGPSGVNLQLADFQEGIVAIDLDRATLDPRVWSGSVASGRLVWRRLVPSDRFFAGGVVTQVVSDGRRVYAFGWDRATEEPLVWTGDGVQWVRKPLPESFGGYPLVAAAGPRGVVVLGHRHTLRGDNPVAWHRTAVADWLPEPDPMLAAVPDPAANECPAIPTDYLGFMVIDAAGIVSCHGDAPITFQAFSVECDGCSGTMEGNPQPAWLLNPQTNQLYLSPDDTHRDWYNSVVLDPNVEPGSAWTNALLQVTGHFDDPAAATCHTDLTADALSYWTGPQTVVEQCRMTFVVTDVTVLSPP